LPLSVLALVDLSGLKKQADLLAAVGNIGCIGYMCLAVWVVRAFVIVICFFSMEVKMWIVKILLLAMGAFLNRVRGGLFDFSGNKLLFPLFLSFVGTTPGAMLCIFIAAYVGQQFGWGTYIGALYGSRPEQAEVPQIDEIVNSVKITLKGKTTYLSEYPRVWGFVALLLRGLMWSFLIGLAVQNVRIMLCGVLMPFCYALTGMADSFIVKKGGKTAWNLGEWLWGAVLTAFVLW